MVTVFVLQETLDTIALQKANDSWKQKLGVLEQVESTVPEEYRDLEELQDDIEKLCRIESKTSFALMIVMTKVNLLGSRRGGGPALTLPVGR